MSKETNHPDILKASRLAMVSGLITGIPLIGLASFFLKKKVHTLMTKADKEMQEETNNNYKTLGPMMHKMLWHLPTAAWVANILLTVGFIGFYFWVQHTISSAF